MQVNLFQEVSRSSAVPHHATCNTFKDLNVLDDDGLRARGSDGSQDLAALLNVNDGTTGDTNSAGGGSSISIRESDGTEVSEWNKSVILLEILDDPFSVGLAELVALGCEAVGDSLASGDVLNDGGTGLLASGSDGHLDNVTSSDGNAREVIGVVWVPFIPGIEGGGGSLDTEVDTGLEDGGFASVTVDTDPCGGTVLGAARTTRWDSWGWDGDLTGDRGVAGTDKNDTSPVAGVVDVRDLVEALHLDPWGGGVHGEHGVAGTTRSTLFTAGFSLSLTALGVGSSNSGTGKQRSADDGSRELHDERRI